MPTPHINANVGDFAETVLMPGDPLRAKLIAETYLSDVRQVCDVRNMFGYTGLYKGKPLSVMGHGMGIPSCSIYVTELIKDYGVKNIIRVGSCGAVKHEVKVRDIILAMGACTDSKVNRMRFNDHDYAAIADFDLLTRAAKSAQDLKIDVKVGNIFSADLFYSAQPNMIDVMDNMGILAVEMELSSIYAIAAQYGVKALGVLTVSDHIRTGEATTSEERQTSFHDMMQLALETAHQL